MAARLHDLPAAVYDAHVASRLSLADAARVAVTSRTMRAMAAPGVQSRVDDTVAKLKQLMAEADGQVHPLGDGRVKVTADARGASGQRVATMWLVNGDIAAHVPIVVDVHGPGRARVVRAYDPPPLRARPLLRRAVRVSKISMM